jgi:hypothetical protein
VSSLAHDMDIDIEVRRRNDGYVLIAYQFGVVVRSKELNSGMEELERRIAIIAEDLRGVGVPVRSDAVAKAKDEIGLFRRLAPSLIIILTVAVVFASLVVLATAPIVAVVANVRSEILSALAPPTPTGVGGIEIGTGIARVGRLGIDFIIKFSQTLDQVTPERKEELKTAIRKIAREVDLIIEDVKTAPPPSPQQPSSGDKR